jgi:hypothetical protein
MSGSVKSAVKDGSATKSINQNAKTADMIQVEI